MLKKVLGFVFAGLLLLNVYGCFWLVAGAAGGAGTSVWLGGKLTQEVNASFDRSIDAAKSALKSLKLDITKETKEEKVAQIMSKYTDGKTIWIDVHRVTETSSRIEVRVGAVSSDKEAAAGILKRITQYL